MKLQDLVVVLDGSAHTDAVLSLATAVARRHDAHLTGFCPLEALFPIHLGFALSGYPEAASLQEAANRLEAQALEKAQRIETDIREQLRRHGARGDWQIATGPVGAAVAHRAHAADLLVLGQNDPDHPPPPAASRLIEDALMDAGCPLLIVPYAGRFDAVGNNVLIGWNGTREAARAAHDALLLIEPTATVTVLTVERGRTAVSSSADIAEHLARHGLKVSADRTIADGTISDADALLAYVSDESVDLLVVGGYGHSRVREMVLGGVTRDVLRYMTVPVLMSH
jgi:nucleotide-binding universal stress UspA family protein